MPRSHAKATALLAALAVALWTAGCGGSDETTETAPKPSAATEAPTSKAKPSAPEKRKDGGQEKKENGKEQGRKGKKQPGRNAEQEARELARKLAESGTPIPADSPVARKILQSLQGSNGKKKKKSSLPSTIDQVISPEGGDKQSGGAAGNSPSVEKILEQIQE